MIDRRFLLCTIWTLSVLQLGDSFGSIFPRSHNSAKKQDNFGIRKCNLGKSSAITQRCAKLCMVASNSEEVKSQLRWLPPSNPSVAEAESSGLPDTMVLPIFPLGSVAYCPDSTHVLNIFEPRYRKLYDDILLNGSRRFVVTMANVEQAGQFAEVGVIFYLKDLREVSEQTQDQVKYICEHEVIGRVKILSILNPLAGIDRSTYMKAEVLPLEDVDTEVDCSAAESEMIDQLEKVVKLQGELGEEVRFIENVRNLFDASRTGEKSLWAMVELWKVYLSTRMSRKSQSVQQTIQQKLVGFLKE